MFNNAIERLLVEFAINMIDQETTKQTEEIIKQVFEQP